MKDLKIVKMMGLSWGLNSGRDLAIETRIYLEIRMGYKRDLNLEKVIH